MSRKALAFMAVVAALSAGAWPTAAAPIVYNRAAEWTTAGLVHGSSAGNPVNGIWKYEYVPSGDGLSGADPWWDNPGVLSVWDNSWYGQPGVWARGDNANPPISQTGMTHTINAGNFPNKPRASWIAPADSIVDITGTLSASWGGGATQDLEMAVGRISGKNHTLLWSGLVSQGGPTSHSLSPVRALKAIDVSQGDLLVVTTRAVAQQAGWVPVSDSSVNYTAYARPLGAGDLLGYWKFDDAGNPGRDYSPRGNSGNVGGAIPSGDVPAQVGQGGSLSFDGANDYVQVPGINGSMNRFSVGWWMKPAGHANYDQQIKGTPGWDQFVFHTGNNGEVWVGVARNSNWSSRFDPSQLPAGTLQLDQWQHFAFTFDNGVASFYKNGTRLAYKENMDLPANWTSFSIGVGGGDTVNGLVDDVAVWDGSLHAKAVKGIASGLVSPGERYAIAVLNDNPVAYWRMDDAPGSTVARDVTASHDGIYAGSVVLGRPGAFQSGNNSPSADFGGGNMTASSVDGLRDNFSVEWWMKPDTAHNYNQSMNAGGWSQWLFHTTDGGAVYVGQGVNNATQRMTPAELPAGTLTLDEWQQFVYTFEELNTTQGLAKFYKNGELLAVKTLLKGSPWTQFHLAGNLDGGIDEVAVYGYALSAEQVREHYYTAIPEPATFALFGLGALAAIRRRRRA